MYLRCIKIDADLLDASLAEDACVVEGEVYHQPLAAIVLLACHREA